MPYVLMTMIGVGSRKGKDGGWWSGEGSSGACWAVLCCFLTLSIISCAAIMGIGIGMLGKASYEHVEKECTIHAISQVRKDISVSPFDTEYRNVCQYTVSIEGGVKDSYVISEQWASNYNAWNCNNFGTDCIMSQYTCPDRRRHLQERGRMLPENSTALGWDSNCNEATKCEERGDWCVYGTFNALKIRSTIFSNCEIACPPAQQCTGGTCYYLPETDTVHLISWFASAATGMYYIIIGAFGLCLCFVLPCVQCGLIAWRRRQQLDNGQDNGNGDGIGLPPPVARDATPDATESGVTTGADETANPTAATESGVATTADEAVTI